MRPWISYLAGIFKDPDNKPNRPRIGVVLAAVIAGAWTVFSFFIDHKASHERGPGPEQVAQIQKPLVDELAAQRARNDKLTEMLLEKNPAAGPGAQQAVGGAVQSIAQGAAEGDSRLQQALEHLKANKIAEATQLLYAVAKDKTAHAEQATTQAEKDRKEAAIAYRNLGAIAGLADPKRALEAYEKALALDPDDLDLGMLLGAVPQTQAQPRTEPRPQSPPELHADAGDGFRIEFLGQEPSSDWAQVADLLVDKKLVPLETLQLRKGQNPCGAVLEQLGFLSVGLRCSAEMNALIKKLNPNLASSPPIGDLVNYPKLPIVRMSWYAGFDLSLPGEEDRYKKISEAWKAFKTGEKSARSQVQVEFSGFQAHIAPPDSTEMTKTLAEIERYDPRLQMYVTRVLSLSKNPLMKPFSMSDPIGSAEQCRTNPADPPPPPLPNYISLLGGSKDDLKCVTNCTETNNCPEIVLLDQAVAPHPDIALALQVPPANGTPRWCPFANFNPKKSHGTHMAGLMVSSGKASGFPGLAPNAILTSQDFGSLFEQNIPNIVKEKGPFNNSRQNLIFVFASQFPSSRGSLASSTLRLNTPPYVSDIRNSLRLWIVAAGQKTDQQPDVLEIGLQTNASPMNLGDLGGVLVVTACEKCYSNQPIISSWANYSGRKNGGGLVNIAAPGGTEAEQIPSPVTELEYGLAYGTSQSTALIGGLAAAMLSCYPQSYSHVSLKLRLLATARPPISDDVAQKVSTGIVDASEALLDPNVHWITRKSTGAKESFKEINWCKELVSLKELDDSEEPKDVQVKNIRRLVRNGSSDSWFVFFQSVANVEHTVRTPTIHVGILAPAAEEKLLPLLYLRQGRGTEAQPPIPIDEIEDLLVGLDPNAKSIVPTGLKGCRL